MSGAKEGSGFRSMWRFYGSCKARIERDK